MRVSKFIVSFTVLSLLTLNHFAFADKITGAGASFPAPIYSKWADGYNKETGHQVNYQSIGSSAGVKQILAKTVDFGASDAPLSNDDLAKNDLLQFPTVIGGVVPVVNIKGVNAGDLKLTGEVLADIYLGDITHWNDEKIKALNPNVNLPEDQIAVVRRADGSGTSFVFTTYLTKVNQKWADKIGAANAVKWPVGVGGKGNEGVSAFVMRLPNSIGYVEYAYAKQNDMSVVALENKAKKFVMPNSESFEESAKGIDWTKGFGQDMTNSGAENAWPITTTTYILLHKKADHPKASQNALEFFKWAYGNGKETALSLDYVTFPDEVVEVIEKSWLEIKDTNGNPIYQP